MVICAWFRPPNNWDSEDCVCLECGADTHAGYNVAKNIGPLHPCRRQMRPKGGGAVDVRLNSRTQNADRAYGPPARNQPEQEPILKTTALAVG